MGTGTNDGAGRMTGRTVTVLHTSDFQCGKPFVSRAADALVRLASRVQPDLIVCSGDLTQRAKKREFTQARNVLDRLGDAPVVVTPGNHDVPLYRFWERLVAPYGNWRAFAGPELDTVTRVPGATVVALNSSAPRRAIVNGRVDSGQVDFARQAFSVAPAGDRRIVVVHHHFIPVPGGLGGPPLPGAAELIRAFVDMDVDVVLGGHVHQLHVRTSADAPGGRSETPDGRPLPFVACGTTLSSRGRGPEASWNGLTVLRLSPAEIRVTPHSRAPDASEFEALEDMTFPTVAAWKAEEPADGGADARDAAGTTA